MTHRVNFNNCTLNVAMNISPPYIFLKQSNQTLNRFISDGGSEFRLLDTLAKHFNFQYEIFNTNASWGAKYPNGSWSGLIGRIIDQKSDIGLGGITLNFERYEALPFLYPHIVSRVSFVTAAPQMAPNLYLVLKPFTYDVWTAFIFSLVACFIVDRLYFVAFGKSFFLISVYALFRQQYHDNHSGWFQRIWMIFWIIFTFILTTAYAGNLVSLITIPIRMKTIDTIQDLLKAAESNQITITGLDSAYFDALKKSSLPVYKALTKYLNEVLSKNEGYSLVARENVSSKFLLSGQKNRQYAFISTEESLRYGQMLFGENRIYMTSDLDRGVFFTDLLAFPVKKNFPYKKQFNRAIFQIIEAGLFNYWNELEYRRLKRLSKYVNSTKKQHEKSDNNNNNNSNNSHGHFDNFNISQLQSFFFIYLLGILISFIIFITELFWSSFYG